MPEMKPSDLSQTELLSLDYGQKQDTMLVIGQRMLDLRSEYVTISGRYAEIKAELDMLKHVKQILQSDLKATQTASYG